MKILNPKQATDLNLDKEVWRRMKETLERKRNLGHWGEFVSQAYAMTILAADEVVINDDGTLDFVFKEKETFKSVKKPRPERKSF